MKKKLLIILSVVVSIGFLLPDNIMMPVTGATSKDYNEKSFWYYPWGKSGTHKGVDVFAKKGTPVHTATPGIVVFAGQFKYGGNVVLSLGAKWRLHYYAHLEEINVDVFSLLGKTTKIGTVGDSGNARGKQPHLHYSIRTLFPYFWQIDDSPQGWKKMFFLNPITYFEAGN